MSAFDNLVKNINVLIEKEKISKAELARRAKMKDAAQLHNILSGRNAPGLDVMERLATALRTNVAGLLAGDAPTVENRGPPVESMRLAALRLILGANEKKLGLVVDFLESDFTDRELDDLTTSIRAALDQLESSTG